MPSGLIARIVPGLVASLSFAVASPAAIGADPKAEFDRAAALFAAAREHAVKNPADHEGSAKRHLDAAEAFVAAWKAGAATPEVFTNAANAYYFAGRVGEAVLFYRRALLADPENAAARGGLAFVEESLPIRRPAGSSATSVLKSFFFWHDIAFWRRKALVMALVPAAFAAFIAALYRRQPFLALGFILLVPALALLASVAIDAAGGSARGDAVVLVEVVGRRGDGATYSPSHSKPFPPGTEVSIQGPPRSGAGSGDAWVPVRLLDGSESWVPERATARVLP